MFCHVCHLGELYISFTRFTCFFNVEFNSWRQWFLITFHIIYVPKLLPRRCKKFFYSYSILNFPITKYFSVILTCNYKLHYCEQIWGIRKREVEAISLVRVLRTTRLAPTSEYFTLMSRIEGWLLMETSNSFPRLHEIYLYLQLRILFGIYAGWKC